MERRGLAPDNAAMRKTDSSVLLAFVAMVLIGGSNFVAVRLSDRGLAPLFGAGVRFFAAGILLFLFIAAARIALPTRRQLTGTLLYGLLNFAASYAFAYLALVWLSAGVAAIVMGAVPLLTLVLASVQGVEKFRVRGIAGAVIAVAGIAVLFGGPAKMHVHAAALPLMLGAAVSAAESSVVLKKLPTGHPAATNAVAMAFGGLLLIGASALFGEQWSLPSSVSTWSSLLYLIGPGSIGLFALFLFTLKRWSASRVSYLFVLTPIVASGVGAALTGEVVSAGLVAGGAIVLVGVYVGALSRSRVRPPQVVRVPETDAVTG